jgi:thiamine transport system permease protein
VGAEGVLRKFGDLLNALSTRKAVKYTLYASSVAVFFGLILLPPILGIFTKLGAIGQVTSQTALVNRVYSAVLNSFAVGLAVALCDVAAGIPMAWLITRGKSKWLNVLDTLADVPFIVPTSALGYSLLLFWSKPGGVSLLLSQPLLSPGWLLVAVLHFTFSYPVVVRVVVGALLDYKVEYERAARTLGAAPLTAARTVTFPILKPSLIAAFTLALARSLSETGATFMVAGAFENGPVFLQNMKNEYASGLMSTSTYEGAMAFASLVLIASSLGVFALVRVFAQKVKLPFGTGLPAYEKKLSYAKAAFSRDAATMTVFLIVILLPSLFVALPAVYAASSGILGEAFAGAGIWRDYWWSIAVSFVVAGSVTLLGLLCGLPMAILIARRKFGAAASTVMDTLVNVPLIVPSIALGVSLKFFWQGVAGVPELLLLVFAHLSITYPYLVKSISAALERISVDAEDAAKTLGAKPLRVFTTIVFPLTKYSVLSGAIMVFTRSISETGATLAVADKLPTAPVIIVNWVKGTVQASPAEIGLGCGILIMLSFIILLLLRLLTRGKERY